MKQRKSKYSLLLILATVIWGGAFVAQSLGAKQLGPFTFNSIRFFLGAIALVPAFVYMDVKEGVMTHLYDKFLIRGGVVCGIFLFAAAATQQIGIATTKAGTAGFLTTIYIVLVPVFSIFFGKKPRKRLWISVALALVGMYFLCVDGALVFEPGDIWLIACSVFYAMQIMAAGKYAPHVDVFKLSFYQFLTCGVLGIIPMILEKPAFSDIIACWVPLCYLGFLSSGLACTLQLEAQKRVNATVASIIMSLESVFSLIFGMLILGESLSIREGLGCGIMLLAVLLTELL
ncbi:MAG: DMT family transporter [Lachnospiraceae bacterium]|nr:DMT family transporter [Lachnospiraceae bacterium]